MAWLPEDHRIRGLLILVFLAILAVFFVWHGTLTPDPAMNSFPGSDEIGPDPETYVGQQVAIGGEVIATDPIVIEMAYGIDETRPITLEHVEKPVSVGQDVSAFGTLTDASTLETERAHVRSPWEKWYMYAVSFLAGLWVLFRARSHWTFDRDQSAFVPREDQDA